MWPLVGRERELAVAEAAVSSGDRRGVLLTGEAGVGKTRLAAECLDRAQRAGRPTERVGATEATRSIPLGAFAGVVEPADGAVDLHELLYRAVAVLDRGQDDAPLVLAIDDAHLLDDASVALLHVLANQSDTRLVVTVRSGEVVPEAVTKLWQEDLLDRVELGPLDREAASRLIDDATGGSLDRPVLDRIWRLSGGNPLFLRELVMVAAETESQSRDLVLSGETGPGRRLQELIEARLVGLDDSSREALEVVALAEPAPLSIVEEVVDTGLLEQLERRGLVRAGERGELRVAHPLYAEVLRQQIPGLRRRATYRALAAVAERRTDDGTDRLRVAAWRLESGEAGDRAQMVGAAQEALARFDHGLAERLAREAGGIEGIDAGLALANALIGQGRPAEAEEVLAQLDPGTSQEVSRVAGVRALNLLWGLHRSEDGLRMLEDAERRLEGPPRLECEAVRSHILFQTGSFEEALELAERVLASSEAGPVARLRAIIAARILWPLQGRADQVLGPDDEWRKLAEECRRELPQSRMNLRGTRFTALIWSGRYQEAEVYAADRMGIGIERGPTGLEAVLAGGLALAWAHRGYVHRALRALEESLELMRQSDWLGFRAWCCAGVARTAVLGGDLARAHDALAEAEQVRESDPVRSAFAVPDIEISRAYLMAAEGEDDQAVELATLIGTMTMRGAKPFAADALHAVVRFGRPEVVVSHLEELAGECDGPIYPAYATHARGLVDGDPARLQDAAEQFEAVGAQLLAAEAWWQSAERWAVDSRARALTGELRARELVRRCDTAPVGIRFGEEEGPSGLTAREREVARLAGKRLSTKDLAERLDIAPRTAETHLHRVYRKLDVGGREELAAVVQGRT